MPRTKEQFEEIRSRTKLKILKNALELFAEKGFKGTSISDIAKAAGVSKGLAYNYFKDKNELMFAVFGLLTQELESVFSSINKKEKPDQKLKIFIESTFNKLRESEKFWRLYMNFTLSAEMQNESKQFLGPFIESAIKEIEKIFTEMNVPNPENESRMFAAIIDGICFHYLFDKEKYPLEEMQKYLITKYCKVIS